MCATQRSGSTLLCELLKDTGVAGRPEEYFEAMRDTGSPPHPADYLGSLPPTGAGIRSDPRPPEAPAYSSLHGLSSYRRHLDRSFALGTTPNRVFGSKLMWRQLPELQALAAELPEYAGLEVHELLTRLFHGPAYVWVSRADKIRQAVSMWRALQSRRWRAGAPTDADRKPELVYSFEGIDHLAEMFEAEDRSWAAFFAEHDISALRISYEEELERDRAATVHAVLHRLGITPRADWHAPEPTARQADALSEDWVATYHRDRARRTGRDERTAPTASDAGPGMAPVAARDR